MNSSLTHRIVFLLLVLFSFTSNLHAQAPTHCDSLSTTLDSFHVRYPSGTNFVEFSNFFAASLGSHPGEAYWLSELSGCSLPIPGFIDCHLADSLLHLFRITYPSDSIHCFDYRWVYMLNQAVAGRDPSGEPALYTPGQWMAVLDRCGIVYPAPDSLPTRCDSTAFVLSLCSTGHPDQLSDPSLALDLLYGFSHYDSLGQSVSHTSDYWFAGISACSLCSSLISCDTLSRYMDTFLIRFPQYSLHCPPFVLASYFENEFQTADLDDMIWPRLLHCCQLTVPAADSTYTACDTAFTTYQGLIRFPRVIHAALPEWFYDRVLSDYSDSLTFAAQSYMDSVCGLPAIATHPTSLSTHCDSISSVFYVYDVLHAAPLAEEELEPGDIYAFLYLNGAATRSVRTMRAFCTPGLCDSFITGVMNITNDTICHLDTAVLTVSAPGGAHYEWGTGDTTASVSVTSGGLYLVTVMDTAWCAVSGIGSVLEYVIPTPTLIPVAVASDTPVSIAFDYRQRNFAGYNFEWSLDSAFSSPYTSDSFALHLSPDTFAAVWLRNTDSVSGCRSRISMTVAIVGHSRWNPSPGDTLKGVCKGNSLQLPLIASSLGKLYKLMLDSLVVDSAFGNGDTLILSTGILDTSAFFTISMTDTMTHFLSIADSGVFIQVFPPVSKPEFLIAETDICTLDTLSAWYTAIADNATLITYSILDTNTARIDSMTGKLISASADFTVRAHAWGLPLCGEETTDWHVTVTDIGLPIVPETFPIAMDTSFTVIAKIDSILPGTHADKIEWSADPDFKTAHLVSSPATISLSLSGLTDTIIYIRSYNSLTSKHSRAIEKTVETYFANAAAGLMDKTGWKIQTNVSDEFKYTSVQEVVDPLHSPFSQDNGNGRQRKWWFNFTTGINNPDPAFCAAHRAGPDAVVNSGNMDGMHVDGSGNEVTFQNGYARLQCSLLPTPLTFTCEGVTATVRYKTANLCGLDRIEMGDPVIVEFRAKRKSSSDMYDDFWVYGGNEYDIAENVGPSKGVQQVIHDNFHGTDHSDCGKTFFKESIPACDFSEDWHTYAYALSGREDYGGEMVFFIDGKEKWSRHIDGWRLNANEYILIGFSPNSAVSGGSVNVVGSPEFLVDYCRVYVPAASGYQYQDHNILQHLGNAPPKTLEDVGTATRSDLPDYGFGYRQVNTFTKLSALRSGSIFYQGNRGDLYKVFKNLQGNWQGELLNGRRLVSATPPVFSWSNFYDVGSDVTPLDENTVFYTNTSNFLTYTVKVGSYWERHFALNVNRPISNCKGLLNIDNLQRVFYLGIDNNIYASESNRANRLPNTSTVAHSMIVAPCGCLIFYVDYAGRIHQMSYNGTWQDFVVVSTIGVREVAWDDTRSRIYFIGGDNSLYYYAWDYNHPVADGVVRLAYNSTESNNSLTLCPDNDNALSGLIVDGERELVYYTSRGDGNGVWYAFNDYETYTDPTTNIVKSNWNKTQLNCLQNIDVSAKTLDQYGQMLFRSRRGDLCLRTWKNADAPIHCYLHLSPPNDIYIYKTDTNSIAGLQKDSLSKIKVTVRPNPSENFFNIAVTGINASSALHLIITSIDGQVVYDEYSAPGGTHFSFLWDSRQAGSGIYIYKVTSGDGASVSGKMIKLE